MKDTNVRVRAVVGYGSVMPALIVDFVRLFWDIAENQRPGNPAMAKPFDPSTLPSDIANLAASQVAAGLYPDDEAVLRAGVCTLQRRSEKKLAALRAAIDEGDASPDAEYSLQGVLNELGLPKPRP